MYAIAKVFKREAFLTEGDTQVGVPPTQKRSFIWCPVWGTQNNIKEGIAQLVE